VHVSWASQASRISFTLPVPMYVRGLGSLRRCVRLATGVRPAVETREDSSARDSSRENREGDRVFLFRW
jgi:hypothetical protein